ncbi:MAG TPA: 1-acyl-sn-glycerol-3-phosphate acyltransferase [Prolixibacteraceae bacterium]|nr:1-acyl-sn-glycerol-3-phosphate acyltransferase [Prolixibacteraceae bacterium]
MERFDDIRPYTDDEMHNQMRSLIADPVFRKVAEMLYGKESEQVLRMLPALESIDQFQNSVIYPLLERIETMSTGGITFSTMNHFHPEDNYLFVSNHRDIILDSAFLNVVMHRNGFRKTEIAIGDNLLIYDWIEKLVRINRSFIVKRNLGIREQLAASNQLSAYIRHTLTRKGESVWIAQREGRTKDGNDLTQAALIKMLNMSNDGSLLEGFFELNIVPMAISYEIEPCGISKVAELLNRKHNPGFLKTQEDDLKSMAGGFMMPKGRVHFGFGNPLNFKLVELVHGKKANEAIQSVVEYIDKRIYYNYKRWPSNYIASDLLRNEERYKGYYAPEDKEAFWARMDLETASIPFDREESIPMYLQMYANPVINFEKNFPE